MGSIRAGLAGAVVVCAAAASARAQDYTVTQATGLYETRPASATQIAVVQVQTPALNPIAANVTLPFQFPYYGSLYSNLTVTTTGLLLLPQRGAITNPSWLRYSTPSHGQSSVSGAFPYTQSGVGGVGPQNFDGLIAPLWTDTGSCGLYSWTTGMAPTRHVVFAWESFTAVNSTVAFQAHLYEGTGRIEFAYGTFTSSGPQYGETYVCGLDSPIDSRFTAPRGAGPIALGPPGGDFVFDPRPVTYAGRLLYDQTAADETGIGNSTLFNQPMYGATLALVRGDGGTAAYATTATDGSFSLTGLALPSSASGSIVVSAQNAACFVWPQPGTAATTWTPGITVSFSSGADVGTHALDLGADSVGDLRAAFHVARVCLRVHDWATQRTSDPIAPIYVFVDGNDLSPTEFLDLVGDTMLRVAGRSATNPDVWDDSVLTRFYSRHVLTSIAAGQNSSYDFRFDAVSDPQNAFAEAFGCYLWAAMSGRSSLLDATHPHNAVTTDLENPSISVQKGPDVAGCVAGALYDLLDPANEKFDAYDGTSAPDRVFHVVDSMTSAPTSDSFLQAWVDAGYDGQALSRIYVGNSLLVDDAFEPNDSAAEAAPLGNVGVRKTGLVLNRFDEDWFSTTLASSTGALEADAVYDPVGNAVLVALEIRDASGASVLSTNGPIKSFGVVHVETGPVPAGTYLIRARLVPGAPALKYALQVYVPAKMDTAPLRDWTVGRVYDASLGVSGGVPPYKLMTMSGAMPPGLGLDLARLQVIGRPTTSGTYGFSVQLIDGGDPAAEVWCVQSVVFHDAFKLPIAPFVAFPAGRAVDAVLPTSGGTQPFTLTTSGGALPTGLSLAVDTLHVVGTALAQSSVPLTIDGVDAAGSSDHVAARAVVAVEAAGRRVPASLFAGADACGWWFDAVKGSSVGFTVVTAPKRPKRGLEGVLLAPDRSVVPGGRILGRPGALAASGFVCPASGRYCFIASTADSGPATELLGTAVVAPSKSGAGSTAALDPDATTSVEIGATPGASLVFKFDGDAKQGFAARIVSVADPSGLRIAFQTFVKSTRSGGVFRMPTLALGGTWTIVLGATSITGERGKLTYSYSLKSKKGAAYSAD